MFAFSAVILGILGLAIGSFLNVLIWRVPQREPIVHARSKCPHCEHALAARDLVPVFSWIFLKGKCRNCHQPISPRYPLVELFTSAMFVALAFSTDMGPELPAELVFVCALIVLSMIDFDTKILPSRIIYPAGLTCFILLLAGAAISGEWGSMSSAMIGAVGAFLFYFIVWFIAPSAMGYGDVRLSALIGLCLGWYGAPTVVWGIFGGFLYGSVIGVGLIVFKNAGRKTAIPFGPYMALAALTALFWTPAVFTNFFDVIAGRA